MAQNSRFSPAASGRERQVNSGEEIVGELLGALDAEATERLLRSPADTAEGSKARPPPLP